MTNENCLEGIKCPGCSNEDRLLISASIIADVTDAGADIAGGYEMEWDDSSLVRCPVCDRTGSLSEFHTPPSLPPDPEGMNDRRAGWAAEGLTTFRSATGVDEPDAVCDLLTDLMHWCDRHGQDFDSELERARDHYDAETLGEALTN